ncbi:hypothetical protein T261_3600 [Streptomyces lydicus]|nr:hypothetical protein T261_3600 [Streptomyces lydicus]
MKSSGCIGFGRVDARRIIQPLLTGIPSVSPIGQHALHGGPPGLEQFGTIYPPGVYGSPVWTAVITVIAVYGTPRYHGRRP